MSRGQKKTDDILYGHYKRQYRVSTRLTAEQERILRLVAALDKEDRHATTDNISYHLCLGMKLFEPSIDLPKILYQLYDLGLLHLQEDNRNWEITDDGRKTITFRNH